MIEPLDNQGVFGRPAQEIRSRILQSHRSWFEHAHVVNRAMHNLLPLIKPHQLVAQEMLASALFVRSLTQYQSVLILAIHGLPEECKILLRSLIELVIYLRAIHEDKAYAEDYVRNHDRERLRLYKLIMRSPFLKENLDPDTMAKEHGRLADSLRGKTRGFTLEQYADAAKMLPILHTAYKLFCGTVHTGAQCLEVHLNGESPETVKEIRYGMSDDGIAHALLTATELMLLCVEPLTQRLALPDIPELKTVMEQHQSICKEDTEQVGPGDLPQGVGSPNS